MRRESRWLAAVAVLTAAAFALRFSQLHQTLAGDETFTYTDVVGHSLRSVLTTVYTGGENSPPLFFAMAWLTAKLGNPSIWIRLPSVILGTATVPVIYAVGRETVGRGAGTIAAGIVALAPFPVFYGIEARPYASMMFFVILSTLALMRAVRPAASRWWWVLYTLSAAAAAYSHYTCVFLLAVQAAWSMWLARDRIAYPLVANIAVVILYIPWLPHLRGKQLAVIGDLYALGVHRVLTDLLRPFPGHPSAPLRAIPTYAGLAVVAICVLAGAAALARTARGAAADTRSASRLPDRLAGLVALTLATPVGLLVYSLCSTDLWLPRGLSASIPAEALVVGALLASLPLVAAGLAAALIAATLVFGSLRSLGPKYDRGPYRTIASYLDHNARPRDPVEVISVSGGPAIREQVRAPHRFVALRPGPHPFSRALWSETAPGGTAYLVIDDTIDRDQRLGIPRHPGFRLIYAHDYSGGPSSATVLGYRRAG